MDMDNEVLIATIFKKPALWDKRNKFYCKRNVNDRCWKEISLEMKQDENKLRKRWRYLRDQFAVELGKVTPRSGDTTITASPKWPYFKPLLFLKDVVKARATPGSVARRRSSSEVLDPDAEVCDSESTFDVLSPSSSPRHTEDGEESDHAVKRSKKSNSKVVDVEHQKHRCLYEKEKHNEHILFFKSLLPHINRIPQHMLLTFRNRIQSVVEEFAYKPAPFNNPSSSSHPNLTGASRCSSTDIEQGDTRTKIERQY